MNGLSGAPARLFIFDADDTLRRTTVAGQPCPHRASEWELMPGVRETLRRYDWVGGGLRLGIASNQDHVGYGLLSHHVAVRLLDDLVEAAIGTVRPAAHLMICPHPAEARCPCRKPAPGMLLALMARFRIPPGQTLFVGNADSDRLAALRARVGFVWADTFFGRAGA